MCTEAMEPGRENGIGREDGVDGLVGDLVGQLPDSATAADVDGSIGTAVLGAGPAGLSAAYVLATRGVPGVVFEADGQVGGIAKTVKYKGYRFDLGGHRFFTKLKPIQELWEQILNGEFLTRPRLSRIYYKSRFISYPLQAKDVVRRLGLIESALCAFSYLWHSRRRHEEVETFEEWVTIRFGKRLYNAFFRSYSEKVWGIPGSEIRSQWAAQRIKNFSLGKAILSLLGLRREHVTTLIEEFRYPRLGPGQMWESFADQIERRGIPVRLRERCMAIRHADDRVRTIVVRSNGDVCEHAVDAVLSSIPLQELIFALDPPPPEEVLEAAHRLRYRDLCLVALMTTEAAPFPDNWIYLHDPGTRAGRVQNFGAWSDDLVQPGTACLGVEYFCFRGDDIWTMPDDQAVELAKGELARIGLIDPTQVFDGVKVLVPNAYPMYDSAYEGAVDVLRDYLERFDNLKTFGRNGLHRYNNQDHSMWTGILSALNLVAGTDHDVWSINTDADYLEDDTIEPIIPLSIDLREGVHGDPPAPVVVFGSR
jgi:protoporphyrinogen oxidase